jgi:hypothetical protein
MESPFYWGMIRLFAIVGKKKKLFSYEFNMCGCELQLIYGC